jgi:uncharacterized OB-fold protein
MILGPAPRVTAVDRPFWDGCNAERLMLQRCLACQRHVFFPRVCCPYCGGGALEWREVSGRGIVRTFTVQYRPGHEAFQAQAPYVFAAVVLEEGPLIYARLNVPAERTEGLMGCRVRTGFRQDLPGQRLVVFEKV